MIAHTAHHCGRRRRAFTLLEVMISVSLLIILLAIMFTFYRTTISQTDAGANRSRQAQLARVVLDRIKDEIRHSVNFSTEYGPGVYGTRDRLEINTVHLPDRELTERRVGTLDEPLPGQFDIEKVNYFIAYDDQSYAASTNGEPLPVGLVRRVEKTYLRDVVIEGDDVMDAEQEEEQDESLLATKTELYAPEILFLEFAYFDGARWWDEWQLTGPNSLPQLVKVTIGFIPIPEAEREEELDMVDEDFLMDEEDLEPLQADRYTTVIRVPQADLFYGSRITRESMSVMGGGS